MSANGGHINNNIEPSSGLNDESSVGSRDDSRSSSMEKDASSDLGVRISSEMKHSASDDEDRSVVIPLLPPANRKVGLAAKKPGRKVGPKGVRRRKRVVVRSDLEDEEELVADDFTSTPQTDSNSSHSPQPNESGPLEAAAAPRPIRAAVANAAAINDVRNQDEEELDLGEPAAGRRQRATKLPAMKRRGRKPLGSSNLRRIHKLTRTLKRKDKSLTAPGGVSKHSSRVAGLDLLHKTTMDLIYGKYSYGI